MPALAQPHPTNVAAPPEPVKTRSDLVDGAASDRSIAGDTPTILTVCRLRRAGPSRTLEEARGHDAWYLTFEGGCIAFAFDAQGPGAGSLADEVRDALGLVPLEVFREAPRDAGYEI